MNKHLDEKVKNAFEKITPDVLDKILADCDTQKGNIMMINEPKKRPKKWLVASLATAASLVAISIAGFSIYSSYYAVQTTVLLDVNPSISFTANSKDKVVEASALNADAQTILNDMNLSGTDLNIALNAVLGAMLREGYITQDANSVLLSVNSQDAAHGIQLQDSLTADIQNVLGQAGVEPSVLSQTVPVDETLSAQAQANNISTGKAQLIEQLLAQNPSYTFETLAALSVNDLNLLAESVPGVHVEGKASESAYIGDEAALSAALTHAGVANGSQSNQEIDLDYENGQMVYEVEFDANGNEYAYDIAADTGAVVAHKVELGDAETPSNSAPQEVSDDLIDDDHDDLNDDLDDDDSSDDVDDDFDDNHDLDDDVDDGIDDDYDDRDDFNDSVDDDFDDDFDDNDDFDDDGDDD